MLEYQADASWYSKTLTSIGNRRKKFRTATFLGVRGRQCNHTSAGGGRLTSPSLRPILQWPSHFIQEVHHVQANFAGLRRFHIRPEGLAGLPRYRAVERRVLDADCRDAA